MEKFMNIIHEAHCDAVVSLLRSSSLDYVVGHCKTFRSLNDLWLWISNNIMPTSRFHMDVRLNAGKRSTRNHE